MSEQNAFYAVEFPCLACSFVSDNPFQILDHYEKRHNFELDSYALDIPEVNQYGCPLCFYYMEPSPNALLIHYQDDHDLHIIVEGEEVKENASKRKKPGPHKRGKKKPAVQNPEEQEEAKKQGQWAKQEDDQAEIEAEKAEVNQIKQEASNTGPEDKNTDGQAEVMQKLTELTDMFKNFLKTFSPGNSSPVV